MVEGTCDTGLINEAWMHDCGNRLRLCNKHSMRAVQAVMDSDGLRRLD